MVKDGGPAFPIPDVYTPEGAGVAQGSSGMSLRDYLAAKAMHAELNTAGAVEEAATSLIQAARWAGRSIEDQIAFNAYKVADAMLKARES